MRRPSKIPAYIVQVIGKRGVVWDDSARTKTEAKAIMKQFLANECADPALVAKHQIEGVWVMACDNNFNTYDGDPVMGKYLDP